MRLQKQVNRKVDDKEYAKYVLIIAPEEVRKLGWKEGMELESKISSDTITLKPAKRKPKLMS